MGIIRFVKERLESNRIEGELKNLIHKLEIKRLDCSSKELQGDVDRLDTLVEQASLFNKKQPYCVNVIPLNVIHMYSVEQLELNLGYGKYSYIS